MTGHERIRAALVALLQGVPGTGRVHTYERFSKNPKDFQALYQQGQSILGFYVRRQSYRELVYSSTRNRVRTRWIVQGFASLVDAEASELAFDKLLDKVAAAVRAKPVLFDAADEALGHTVTDDGAALQLEESGPVMFAGVLCHGARFSLTTEHLEQIEPLVSDPTAAPKDGEGQGGTDPDGSGSGKPCPVYRAVIDPSDVDAPAAELIRPFAEGEKDNG